MTRCDTNIGSIDQEKFGHFLPGGLAGTIPAHLMFGLPAISISHHGRSGPAQLLSEFVATFGLL